jgi:inner membrane protein
VADPVRVAVFLLGLIFVLDAIWSAVLSGNGAFLNAVMDEPAHLATCGICLLALAGVAGRLPTRLFIVAALVGSTAIDLDHVPGFLGSQALTAGTSRPYGHTLLTLAILLALAALIRRPAGRTILLGLAFGLSTHLVRDMATGDGVALLWPLSDGSARIPYLAYAAVLCGLVVLVALGDRRPREFSRPAGRGG